MTLKQLLKKLMDEAAELRTKALAGELSDEETARAEEVAKQYAETKAKIDAQEAAGKALMGIASIEVNEPEPQDDGLVGKTLGERFVNSKAYKAFQDKYPHGLGNTDAPVHVKAAVTSKSDPDPLNRVALGTDGVQPRWTDDLVVRAEPTLLDLITVGTTSESYLPYRQVVTKTNNASIVGEAVTADGEDAEGGLKPLSELTTQPAEAKVFDYADGMTVTNQELRDDGAIKALIDSTLRENLTLTVEDIILNGTGLGLEPAGILSTTGVLEVEFETDLATTFRKAKTALRGTRTRIQALVVNPEDAEAWDLQKDDVNRFLGFGPFGTGPSTAWAVQMVESEALPEGVALMGDFRQVHLLIRSALEILAFNQHADYARRNLQYVRAELAAMQLIRRPANLAVVETAE